MNIGDRVRLKVGIGFCKERGCVVGQRNSPLYECRTRRTSPGTTESACGSAHGWPCPCISATSSLPAVPSHSAPSTALGREQLATLPRLVHDWRHAQRHSALIPPCVHQIEIADVELLESFASRCPCMSFGRDTLRFLPNGTLRSSNSASNRWAGGAGSLSSMHEI